ncbi:hypothetical protein RCL_jg3482.t1 [Rhizophagus clarus]|uniref:Uncharacterized protein n=1 Tax=Rhizophagus clarus TaxID=94130 RepID=A0A8H3LZ71_9GLOM|nr:hypothetical protein RCL_jg3482.t1 [Rhizophagus clarus]
MITYWKLNTEKEFRFYDNDEIKEFTVGSVNRNANEWQTTLGEFILENKIIVLIENLWIEINIDLSNKLILEDIGKISDNDCIDDENVNISLTNSKSHIKGKNIMNYNIDDLVNKYGLDLNS